MSTWRGSTWHVNMCGMGGQVCCESVRWHGVWCGQQRWLWALICCFASSKVDTNSVSGGGATFLGTFCVLGYIMSLKRRLSSIKNVHGDILSYETFCGSKLPQIVSGAKCPQGPFGFGDILWLYDMPGASI